MWDDELRTIAMPFPPPRNRRTEIVQIWLDGNGMAANGWGVVVLTFP